MIALEDVVVTVQTPVENLNLLKVKNGGHSNLMSVPFLILCSLRNLETIHTVKNSTGRTLDGKLKEKPAK